MYARLNSGHAWVNLWYIRGTLGWNSGAITRRLGNDWVAWVHRRKKVDEEQSPGLEWERLSWEPVDYVRMN